MIRIDLLRGYRRGRRRILVVAVPLVVLSGLVAARLAGRVPEAPEQLFAATWDRLFGRQPGEDTRGPDAGPATALEPTDEPGRPAVQAGEPQQGGQRLPSELSYAPASGATPLDAPQSHTPASGASAAQLRPAAALAVRTPASGARQGRVCGRLLHLGLRLSASLHLAALACTAAEYQAEGTAPPAQVGQLHALLDGLRQLPSQANLSLWRAGRSQEEQPYRFSLQGRILEPVQPTLEPQTADGAAALFGRVSAWARRAGLQLLAADPLPSAQVAAGLRQDRLRVRVMGSGAQLGVLADSLRRVEARLGLDELALAEVFRREQEEPRLQLTAVLRAVVQAPGPLP